ncbi:MAG: polysaccharide deacetylase family protein, partial [Clostridia bacterium]|nr:polysaccharide deacetylase family protein [Clostridia bacterium]
KDKDGNLQKITEEHKNKKENGVPVCPPEMSFIDDHDCRYIDREAAASGDRVVYLTFDAGYENGNVARVLDTLKEDNVPGAFFVLENLAEREPELLKRMTDDGHTVCNHTAKHRDMTLCRDFTEFSEELGKMEKEYEKATGKMLSKYYRPPEGRFSEENLCYAEKLGYKTVFWSFAYADWDNDRQPDPKTSCEKIVSSVRPGVVLLLHPTSKTNAEILGDVIRTLKKEGYRFGTLDELFDDEKA